MRIIHLKAEINYDENKTTVKPNTGKPWIDFGYWLEATGFMAYQAMLYQGMTEEQILEYAKQYLEKTLKSYSLE